MAIWALIVPSVVADGDVTKKALKSADEFLIKGKLVELISGALPAEKYNTDQKAEPKGNGKVLNALKFTAVLTVKGEAQGSQLTVTDTVALTIEAIKTPEHKKGAELMASGSKGAASQNRGTLDKNLGQFATSLLIEIVSPLVTKMIESKSFASYATSKNLPLPP